MSLQSRCCARPAATLGRTCPSPPEFTRRVSAVQAVKKLKDENYQLDRIRRLSRLRKNLQTAVSGSSDASLSSVLLATATDSLPCAPQNAALAFFGVVMTAMIAEICRYVVTGKTGERCKCRWTPVLKRWRAAALRVSTLAALKIVEL